MPYRLLCLLIHAVESLSRPRRRPPHWGRRRLDPVPAVAYRRQDQRRGR